MEALKLRTSGSCKIVQRHQFPKFLTKLYLAKDLQTSPQTMAGSRVYDPDLVIVQVDILGTSLKMMAYNKLGDC